MTLDDIQPLLSHKNTSLVDSIIKKAVANYPKYKNKDQWPIYNFWQTSPSRHFPNDRILSKLRKFKLPEDFDDTSIIYLTDEHDEKETTWLKEEMKNFVNLKTHKIESTFDEYKNLQAYSTWFGQNMPIDFDICVLTNALGMVYQYQVPLNKYDSASLFLIKDMVDKNYHLSDPAYISPHYKESPVILYHLARFISKFKPEGFEGTKLQIIDDIKRELEMDNTFMENILLSTALMKLSGCPSENKLNAFSENDIGSYNFFVANMASTLSNPWKKWLGYSDTFEFPYVCEAYDYTLILENLVLRKHLECN
jgi:hypothetical protein